MRIMEGCLLSKDDQAVDIKLALSIARVYDDS